MNAFTSRNIVTLAALAPLWMAAPGARANEPNPPTPRLAVSIDFPGGSGAIESIDQEQRTIRLLPSDHPERGWRCWWFIRVTGAVAGETLTVDVGDAPWATPDRAAVSRDGKTWEQTAPGQREGRRIVYRHQAADDTVWFAWGPPFTAADAQALVDWGAKQLPTARAETLATSRGGRDVPLLRIAPLEGEPTYEVWINARQHAWESGSSWVCRGLVEWLVSDDPRAVELRAKTAFSIVPVMDIDNVAIGAGGKNESPHDHNRDWTDAPVHPAVAAAQRRVRAANQADRCVLFLDLHNPGAGSKNPFFYIAPGELQTERASRNLQRFLAAVREEMTGPLAFTGQTIESGAQYDPKWKAISKNWAALELADYIVPVTLETAWNTPHSTTDGYRTVGRQMGFSIERYLRFDPREP